jgi:cytochrome c553
MARAADAPTAAAVAVTAAMGLMMGGSVAQTPAGIPAGVTNPQRAWQNWTLNCQGCHRPDGTGSAGTAPSLAGTVSKFLNVPGGREYLGRVPGVATSPLSNADLADLMNWMFWRFDKEHMPADFVPFTAAELARLRTSPLRLEASPMREALLRKADESVTSAVAE